MWFVCAVVLCLCDWFLPLIHSPTPSGEHVQCVWGVHGDAVCPTASQREEKRGERRREKRRAANQQKQKNKSEREASTEKQKNRKNRKQRCDCSVCRSVGGIQLAAQRCLCRQRSYQRDHARSRLILIAEAKPVWARSVLPWVTRWESRVMLLALFFSS